jgi:hypothetical protein
VNELTQLAEWIKKRNEIEKEITSLIGRPAQIGHVGEFVASKIFNIDLVESASHKSIDGRFRDEPLKGRTVNIKWYSRHEGLLDITPNSLPDYYLVLTGAKSPEMSSRGQIRPWLIEFVFLFDAHVLVGELQRNGIKIGMATSVRQFFWDQAEIYPLSKNGAFQITKDQYQELALFGLTAGG